MDIKVDVTQALAAFQTVVEQGERVDTTFHFEGLHAESDYDGYTLHLGDGRVTLHIYFHNRFELNSNNSRDTEQFLRKLAHITQRG
ncbi:DUF3081 family protein [Reinekea sp. G2M2-21]|uniref:DUF3081 family protein n=1 Tax=Reinekea sp. G2M2-21 TaxID=2788942 RepID=UPI0018AA11A6|nr:DUF3081 family protein [Reinekea sp. G2M2-21]